MVCSVWPVPGLKDTEIRCFTRTGGYHGKTKDAQRGVQAGGCQADPGARGDARAGVAGPRGSREPLAQMGEGLANFAKGKVQEEIRKEVNEILSKAIKK